MYLKIKIKNPAIVGELMQALSDGVFTYEDPGPEGERPWRLGDPVSLTNEQMIRINELRAEARTDGDNSMSYDDWVGGGRDVPDDVTGVPGEPIIAADLTYAEVAVLGMEAAADMVFVKHRAKGRAKAAAEARNAAEQAARQADLDEVRGRR